MYIQMTSCSEQADRCSKLVLICWCTAHVLLDKVIKWCQSTDILIEQFYVPPSQCLAPSYSFTVALFRVSSKGEHGWHDIVCLGSDTSYFTRVRVESQVELRSELELIFSGQSQNHSCKKPPFLYPCPSCSLKVIKHSPCSSPLVTVTSAWP